MCIALGLLYALVLYRGARKRYEWGVVLHMLLGTTRTILVSILAFFLLMPMLSVLLREVEKPILVVAQDASNSILQHPDSAFYANGMQEELQDLIAQLSEDREVRTFTFGERVLESDQQSFNEGATDMSLLAEEVRSRYSDRNLGAVVLLTDGIYNRGRNPIYAFGPINAPIYTVALGDTTVKKDLILKDVAHNRIAYLGNTIPFEATVLAERAKGSSSTLRVKHNGKQILEQQLSFSEGRTLLNIPISLEATAVGIQRYHFELDPVEGESSVGNNLMDVFVDVLDARQKVLLLAASPHPDIGALRLSLEGNENYQVESALLDDAPEDFGAYSLVVLHQVPAVGHSNTSVMEQLLNEELPLMIVLGANNDIRLLEQLGSGFSIANSGGRLNSTQASAAEGFQLFTMKKEDLQLFEQAPPIHVLFGQYRTAEVATLFKQRVGLVETDDPLFFFNTQGQRRTAVVCGEGLWRWRMYAHRKGQVEAFDRLISKTVQFLALKEDKSRFKVNGESDLFENERVRFEAQLYNKSYEAVNSSEVRITISNEEGAEFPFVFNAVGNEYRLDAGSLPVGSYSYLARTELDGENFTESGQFSISALQLEALSSVANHRLLREISERSGGAMVSPNELDRLQELLESQDQIVARSYTRTSLSDLIDIKALFFVLLALLTLEWVLRKRNGAY